MKLLFVYNANSGTLNSLFDLGHKLFSPKTYKCNLCALTFNTFTENTLWKTFREQSTIKMEFYHIDEFETKFTNKKISFPSVLLQKNNELLVILTSKDLKQITSTETLIKKIELALI